MTTAPEALPKSRLRPYRLWFAGAGIAALALAGVWTIDTGPTNALVRPVATVESDGAFHPTETQWSGLRFSPVEAASFRDERATDGKIGNNEDTTTPVFSPYSGRVTRLIARPGQYVERGAPLFAIEASEFVQAQNDLVSAVAAVDKARSKLALAQNFEKRQKELLSIRGGALKDLEQAQSDLVAAQGDLRSAEIALAAVRNRLRILGPYRCRDRCPGEGRSHRRRDDRLRPHRRHGDPAQGRPRPVHQRRRGRSGLQHRRSIEGLADRQRPRIRRPKMKVGAPVEVSVLAHPGRTFNARLAYVAPALDPNTRRLPVRAEIDNADRELMPEMFASFRIVTGEPTSNPAVPQEAVVYEGANARVWVARPQDKSVVSRPVEVGQTANGMVEVKKGLALGENVVTSGTLFIDRAAKRD